MGPEYELAVLVISNILDHDYITWIVHIRYPIFQWILIDPEPCEWDQFNDDLAWDILEWEIYDQ